MIPVLFNASFEAVAYYSCAIFKPALVLSTCTPSIDFAGIEKSDGLSGNACDPPVPVVDYGTT
jgi:hypothetical protein